MTLQTMVLGALLALFSMGAMAQNNTLNTKDLSESQILELQLKAAQLRESQSEEITAAKVSEYTIIGQQVSKAIIATASELGKSVDEVLNTTTGKIVIFVVVWKVIGQEMMGILAGITWFLTLVPAWMYYFRKFCINYDYEYHENGKVSLRTRRGPQHEGTVATFIISAIVILGVGIIMVFSAG